MAQATISEVKGLEVLDSRGNPTVEAWVRLSNGVEVTSMVPSGASKGTHEAHELRDGDSGRYGGKGVLGAVENVERVIGPKLIGMGINSQRRIDEVMLELDGTEQKTHLGANAILAVSMATARAAADTAGQPLYAYLRELYWPDLKEWVLPVPMFNLINGGEHALGSVDFQEFMAMPVGASSFGEGLRWGVEVYQQLKRIIFERGLPVAVGDEGGFVPKLSRHEEVIELIIEAIKTAEYEMERDFVLAMDPAATVFFENGAYHLRTEGKVMTTDELVRLYRTWVDTYPIRSIEDGFAEDDWIGFTHLTREIGERVQIVGDDLFVTNPYRLERGVNEGAANAILVKLNQIGTLSETADVISQAKKAGFGTIISHRSGETSDTFIADLAVACNAGQIKTGAPSRSDRVAKYNQLLRIERSLTTHAKMADFSYR